MYELGHNVAKNYLWDEAFMARGGEEISTYVSLWLDDQEAKGMQEVELYSDSTYSQNRNRCFSTMLIHCLSRYTSIKRITHRVCE